MRGGHNKPWDQKDLDKLVEMYLEGKTNSQICLTLKKTEGAVKCKIQKVKKVLNLPDRSSISGYKSTPVGQSQLNSAFDRAWQGSVPFGHWTITKPWGSHAE